MVCPMHRDAVVPYQQVARFPLVAVQQRYTGAVPVKCCNQALTRLCIQITDVGAALRGGKVQRCFFRNGMTPKQWLPDGTALVFKPAGLVEYILAQQATPYVLG